jgi:threonine dehydrogenase-like Zn-dependent dehydrogenase
VVIETSGDINIINQSLELVAPNGIMTLIGFYEANLNNFDVDRLVVNAVQLKGIAGSYGIIPEVIGLLSSKKLSLKSLITHRYRFSEAIEAMQTAAQKSDTKIKMLVEFDEI